MSGFDAQQITQHGAVTRILVLSTKGSVPRAAGTSMLVSDTETFGTIGGGALEYQAIETAKNLQATVKIQKIPLGPELGQCCGGAVELLFERFETTPDLKPDTGYARPIRANAPREVPLAIARAVTAARHGKPVEMLQSEGWLFEPARPTRRPLWLYGAGHVGRAVVESFQPLPFDITWIDTDAARYPSQILHGVTQLVATNPASLVPYAPDTAFHVVMTFSHALDLDITAAILSRRHAWAGLIGSDTKAARFRKRLAALNLPIERLTCPIGDPSLGKEPAAIAIGLASDLLRRHNEALTFTGSGAARAAVLTPS